MSARLDEIVCVIPTRGDVPMRPIIRSLSGMAGWVVYDNSSRQDLGVYARFAAINDTPATLIATQDDDVILPRASWEALAAAYEPGVIVCNVPGRFRERYTDSALVGFGAIFDRDLATQAFWDYSCAGGDVGSAEFQRTCDIVFTMLAPTKFVDVPYTEFDYASAPTRMWMQPGHFEERESMRQFCRKIRAQAA